MKRRVSAPVRWVSPLVLLCLLVLTGCQSLPRPGTLAPRRGDEIVVAGQFFHTGTPVVLWLDPGGYDAYRVERRFSAFDESSWEPSKVVVKYLSLPNGHGLRQTDTAFKSLRQCFDSLGGNTRQAC